MSVARFENLPRAQAYVLVQVLLSVTVEWLSPLLLSKHWMSLYSFDLLRGEGLALQLAMELRLSLVYLPADTHNGGRKRPGGAVPRCIAGSAGLLLAAAQGPVW